MKKYTKYTDLEQASRDPSLAIITDRITTPEELNKLYAKYRILPKKQKRYSNYYSTEFQGRRVSEMYVLMKDKFKPGGELSEDWQMPKDAFVVSEPDLYYKEESFNKGDTNICFILGHSGSGKSRMASTLEGNVIQMVPLQALFIFYCSFLLNLWYSIEAGVFSRLHIIFRRDIKYHFQEGHKWNRKEAAFQASWDTSCPRQARPSALAIYGDFHIWQRNTAEEFSSWSILSWH